MLLIYLFDLIISTIFLYFVNSLINYIMMRNDSFFIFILKII